MTRTEIHELIDRQLDEWGVKEKVIYEWATLTFQLTFEKGVCKLRAVERETEKVFTPRGGATGG